MKGIFCMLCLAFLISVSASGQTNKKEVGLRVAYAFKEEDLPERKDYRPILILPYYNYYLTKKEKALRLSAFLEGQLSPVLVEYENATHRDLEWELGFNIGPSLSYRIKEVVPYIAVAYGANYITINTAKQADELIFTATTFAGIKKHIDNRWYGDAHFRLRHISNGGMKQPNLGIDNAFIGIGLSKFY